MTHGSSHHGDAEMSAELSEADQHRAIARLAADYQQANRPPLTVAERRDREGNVTLPFTQEMRETLLPISTKNVFLPYYLLAIVVAAVWFFIALIALPLKYFAIIYFPPLVLVTPLYFVFARWMRARRVREVNRLQSYSRYAGQCMITERRINSGRGWFTYRYAVLMVGLSARVGNVIVQFRNGERHEDFCGVTWGTVEYLGKKILSVRDDHDHMVYRYSDTL